MEIKDLNDRLPIHVAVARGSSDVLRELLVAGARVETRRFSLQRHYSTDEPDNRVTSAISMQSSPAEPMIVSAPSTPTRRRRPLNDRQQRRQLPGTPLRSESLSSSSSTVSSPILRAMIPAQPIQSSKPWNCLTQRSIDECRQLISSVEQNWTPDRHSLFTPADRRAVAELLRVGKRLELNGTLQFTDVWPEVLSFCGRGWFEPEDSDEEETETSDIEFWDDNHLSLPEFS